DSPKLIFNTAGTFYVEYFAASGLPITWQDTKGKKINAEVGDMENLPATTKKVKISRQNDFIRSESLILENPDTVDSLPSSGAGPDAPVPDATVPDATVPIKTFQDQWGSVVGNEGIKTCKQLNNAREQIFGLGSVNCESFQQAPKEFPNSKKKKDEDFTQDFQVLMSQLESKIDTLIAATGPQGSYVTKRNEQLGSLESIIGSEIEGDTAFIGSMSDSLKATGSMISARIVQLKDLKSDFDRISGSEVWENISKKYID
ncbi:MAG: hypothetical protein CL512_05000, partial [Actinobacteria bacterium]|nr:hypothetical protein [Actinomycetota bacterium]